MTPKISIVCPVYKAEKYLNRCVDSILSQTFLDWELLLIDDGSLDESGKICDEYARKDSRIKVLHKENGGVSSARQKGVDMSIGEYIIHVDPDDIVEKEMLDSMLHVAETENADVVISDYILEKETLSIYKCQRPESLQPHNILNEIICGKLIGTCWNKLIKTKFYKNSNFPAKLDYSEDVIIMAQIFQNNPHVCYINKAYYHYVQYCNSNSLTNTNKLRLFRNKLEFLNELSNFCDYSKFSDGYDMRYADVVIMATKLNIYTKKEYKIFIKEISIKSNYSKQLSLLWKLIIIIKLYFDNPFFANIIKYKEQ